MQIKQIAQMAGVAPSTVSRVINRSGYVSAEVRARVEEVVRRTGYVPNNIAKSLKAKRSHTIGIVVPRIASEALARQIESAARVCRKRDYAMLLTSSNEKASNETACLEMLVRRQTDGVIIMSSGVTAPLRAQVAALQIPVVITGQQVDDLCCVVHDEMTILRELTASLLLRGYRDPAFLNVELEDDSVRHRRFAGFSQALRDAHLPLQPGRVAFGGFTVEEGFDAMKELWTAPGPHPDAVIAATDRSAVGAMQYLKSIGVAIPDECAVAGIGNHQLSRVVQPELTTVDYYFEEVGATAANLLLDALEQGGRPQGIHFMRYTILERKST